MLRSAWRSVLLLPFVLPALAFAAEQQIGVELNSAETAQNQCRLTFVVENKSEVPIEVLKLDLVVFNRENRVHRRMVTEMGPVRGAKTIVKTYSVDGACTEIRSILVNDITACAPAKPDVCIDNLVLSSRMEGMRLFK
jgi:hypothetical protein